MSTLSALVLLFSYPTSRNAAASSSVAAAAPTTTESSSGTTDSTDSATSQSPTGSATTDDTSSDATTESSTSSSSTSSSSSDSSSSDAGTQTYAGDAVNTQWGLVQVQITVENGKITKSEVLQVPWSNHKDQEINSYAVPILNQETVDAQNSSIDMVSGATVTSVGYIQSLQSAIDQAHLS
ncbi:FMN-binding protein [Nostocoides australiense]